MQFSHLLFVVSLPVSSHLLLHLYCTAESPAGLGGSFVQR